VTEITPSIDSKGFSMHQKQPPAKRACCVCPSALSDFFSGPLAASTIPAISNTPRSDIDICEKVFIKTSRFNSLVGGQPGCHWLALWQTVGILAGKCQDFTDRDYFIVQKMIAGCVSSYGDADALEISASTRYSADKIFPANS
jgi:hypothetical protein